VKYYEDSRPNGDNSFENNQIKESLDKAHIKRIKDMVQMITYAQKQEIFANKVHKKMNKKLIYSLDDYDIRDLFVYYYFDFIVQYLTEYQPDKIVYDVKTGKLNDKYIYLVDFKYNLDYIKDKLIKEITMNNLTNEVVNERIEYLIGELEFCKKPTILRTRNKSDKLKTATLTDKLIAELGGNVVVSKMLNISSEAVSRWKTHGISNERLDMIELRIMKNQL